MTDNARSNEKSHRAAPLHDMMNAPPSPPPLSFHAQILTHILAKLLIVILSSAEYEMFYCAPDLLPQNENISDSLACLRD